SDTINFKERRNKTDRCALCSWRARLLVSICFSAAALFAASVRGYLRSGAGVRKGFLAER
ncbi:MAG: hypothetical protein WBN04_05810, partial [Paracoccaceae bacterium]